MEEKIVQNMREKCTNALVFVSKFSATPNKNRIITFFLPKNPGQRKNDVQALHLKMSVCARACCACICMVFFLVRTNILKHGKWFPLPNSIKLISISIGFALGMCELFHKTLTSSPQIPNIMYKKPQHKKATMHRQKLLCVITYIFFCITKYFGRKFSIRST